jgi:hypothetical protein
MRKPSSPPSAWIAASAVLIGVEVATRLVVGEPYPGATLLLLLACGSALVPFLPRELSLLSIRLAALPALGIAAFAVLLTTVSTTGIPLTEPSIRLAVVGLVALLTFLDHVIARRSEHPKLMTAPRQPVVLALLACVVAFALAAAWDIVGPFPPPGVDWGHYLLYAEEVEVERGLLVEDRYAGEEDRLFADSPGVGALYGGVLIVDGVPSEWLSYGVILLSALSVLTVFAGAGALWGPWAGLAAAAAYAVSPIHIDPVRWHGVGTNLALVFVPLVVVALGLSYRGSQGWRVVVLLGTSLLGVAVSHSTSAFVVAFLVGAALVVDAGRQLLAHGFGLRRAAASWWREGIVRPVALGVLFAATVGAAVVVHLRAQALDFGQPVSFRLFEPDWLSWRVVEDYYSLAFLVVTGASVVLVLSSRRLRHDAALLSVASLAIACAVVAQLWRLEVPFEYRRAVFYLGVAMVMVIGAASARVRRSPWSAAAYALVFAYIAHTSVGLRLPERVLSGQDAKGVSAQRLIELRERIDRQELPDASLLVADRCVNFIVPYLLKRPTIVGFEPWQVGFESRVRLAQTAADVLEGGERGRRLASSLGVGYVVANPNCTPELAARLGGRVVLDRDDVVVIDLRTSAS